MDFRHSTKDVDVPRKSFPVKRVVSLGILLPLFVIVIILCAVKQNPSEDKELLTSAITLKPGLAICLNGDRIANAQSYCDSHKQHQKTDDLPSKRYKYIVVDDEHKLLYCAIPGTGYSSILRLLAHYHKNPASTGLGMADGATLVEKSGLRPLSNFSADEIQMRLKDFYKFVLVRHPLVRLRSAFANIFLSDSYSVGKYSKAIKKMYGKAKHGGGINRIRITFYEFLHLVTASKLFDDEHWMPYYKMCMPCNIRYDAILKLETIQNDIEAVMDRLKKEGTSSTYEVFWNFRNLSKYNITSTVFQTVPPKLLRPLLKKYKDDFGIFGYSWDKEAGAECSVETGNNFKCC